MNWLYLVIHEIAIALKSHLSSAPLTVGGTASKAACLNVRIAPPHTHTVTQWERHRPRGEETWIELNLGLN